MATTTSPNKTTSQIDTRSASTRLEDDSRVISFVFLDDTGIPLASGGDLQTLVELLIQQTARVAADLGTPVFGSAPRFMRLHSSYYSAFYVQSGSTRIGVIADNDMTTADLKKLLK